MARNDTRSSRRAALRRSLGTAVALTVTLALTVAGGLSPAYADTTTTISFDDLPPGTFVDTEYSPQGLTFVQTAGEFGSTGLPVTVASAPLADTDPNVVESTCFGCEFVPNSIRANLATTSRIVSAYVSSGCTTATVSMRGHTAAGDVVATDSALVGDTAMVPLTVTDPEGSDIAFVRFFDDQSGCTIRIDTLAVTLPDIGPPADVVLST